MTIRRAPNKRVQRTRLRSPLTRRPLGTRRNLSVVRFGLALAVLAVYPCRGAFGEAADTETTLKVTEEGESFVLTVPVSRLVMRIPREGLSREQSASHGSTDSPRYFFFANHGQHLFVSGWFESAGRYEGMKKSWDEETAAWRQKHLPDPKDVVFETVGSWNTVLYDVSDGKVSGSHLRAHWVQDGTWIDLNVSLTSDMTQDQRRSALRDLLVRMTVSEKRS